MCFTSTTSSASPTTSVGQTVSIVEGDTLKLMVTIESNLVLDSIDWTQNDEMLMSGTERVAIDNSDLDPPNTISTLIRTSIDRSSDNGSYVLTATNRAGSTRTEFIVDVFCKNAYKDVKLVLVFTMFYRSS